MRCVAKPKRRLTIAQVKRALRKKMTLPEPPRAIGSQLNTADMRRQVEALGVAKRARWEADEKATKEALAAHVAQLIAEGSI